MAAMVPQAPQDDPALSLGVSTALLQGLLRRISSAVGYTYSHADGDDLIFALLALVNAAER
jgi:hypothetical protein